MSSVQSGDHDLCKHTEHSSRLLAIVLALLWQQTLADSCVAVWTVVPSFELNSNRYSMPRGGQHNSRPH